jgi:hypothetical protein
MYKYSKIQDQVTGAKQAAEKPVLRYGITVYVDSDPDYVGPDFYIDPLDVEGIWLFQDCCAKMKAHFEKLNQRLTEEG